jgi:hypothetical protein
MLILKLVTIGHSEIQSSGENDANFGLISQNASMAVPVLSQSILPPICGPDQITAEKQLLIADK